MYIDKNRLTLTSPAAGTVNMAQLPEEAGTVVRGQFTGICPHFPGHSFLGTALRQ